MSKPRKHHFVSQFYLANFTADSSREGQIYAFDSRRRMYWPTRINNIAFERDFNILPAEGDDKFKLEAYLADFEARTAPVLRSTLENRSLPEGEEFNLLMSFIGLLGVRNPMTRQHIDEFRSQMLHTSMAMYLSTPESWKALCERGLRDGVSSFSKITYEEARKLFLDGEFKVMSNPLEYHSLEFGVIDKVIRLLSARDWSIFTTTSDLPFITSDSPVSLLWNLPGEAPPHDPGFGSKHSRLIFPLSKNMCLVGDFDSRSGVVEAPVEFVAVANSMTMLHSNNFVYGPLEEYPCMSSDLVVSKSSSIFKPAS